MTETLLMTTCLHIVHVVVVLATGRSSRQPHPVLGARGVRRHNHDLRSATPQLAAIMGPCATPESSTSRTIPRCAG